MMPSPAQGYHPRGLQPEPAIRRNEPTMSTRSSLADAIRSIPDYPKPGIMFRDITTLLGDARAFRRTVDELVQPYAGLKVDKVAGIEARGFILGGAVAHQLSAGFVPIRKKGKLPHKAVSHRLFARIRRSTRWRCTRTRCAKGERVILVDDLIATGGTADGRREAAAPDGRGGRGRRASSSTCPTSAGRRSCARSTCRCGR